MAVRVIFLQTLAILGSAYYSKPYFITESNISDTALTNVMRTKRDPGLCDCDLTSNHCDSYCCCDWDCRDV